MLPLRRVLLPAEGREVRDDTCEMHPVAGCEHWLEVFRNADQP